MTRAKPKDQIDAPHTLPPLPLAQSVSARSNSLTSPEVGHVLELVRALESDNVILIHQTDAAGARNILFPATDTFSVTGTVGNTLMANAETTARACFGLMRACAANDFPSVAGFTRHRRSTHLVIMAVPKKFFPAGRPVRHDDVEDLLIDMARDGTIPNWGMPFAWIRAAVDCRGGIVDIHENPAFDERFYDMVMQPKNLVGFPNLLIRPR